MKYYIIFIIVSVICLLIADEVDCKKKKKSGKRNPFFKPKVLPKFVKSAVGQGTGGKKSGVNVKAGFCYRVGHLRGNNAIGLRSNSNSFKNCWYFIQAEPGKKVTMNCRVSSSCSRGHMDVYTHGSFNGQMQRVCNGNNKAVNIRSSGRLLFLLTYGTYLRYNCRFTQSASAPTTTTTKKPVDPAPPADVRCGLTARFRAVEIVGGSQVTSNKQYPWMVRLVRSSGSTFCGGALINELWVLTAAHCVAGLTSVSMKLNDLDITRPDGEISRSSVLIRSHTGYNSRTVQNDIALIKLNSPVPYTDTTRPVCLPCTLANHNFDGQNMIIAGWGDTEENGRTSNNLMHVTIPFVTNSACRSSYGSIIRDTNICAGVAGKDSCQGDSGGPGVYSNAGKTSIVGVVSFGYGCARAGYPGAYTRVSSYIDWIQTNTGN